MVAPVAKFTQEINNKFARDARELLDHFSSSLDTQHLVVVFRTRLRDTILIEGRAQERVTSASLDVPKTTAEHKQDHMVIVWLVATGILFLGGSFNIWRGIFIGTSGESPSR